MYFNNSILHYVFTFPYKDHDGNNSRPKWISMRINKCNKCNKCKYYSKEITWDFNVLYFNDRKECHYTGYKDFIFTKLLSGYVLIHSVSEQSIHFCKYNFASQLLRRLKEKAMTGVILKNLVRNACLLWS